MVRVCISVFVLVKLVAAIDSILVFLLIVFVVSLASSAVSIGCDNDDCPFPRTLLSLDW
jgi:hypothetical protein